MEMGGREPKPVLAKFEIRKISMINTETHHLVSKREE